MEPTETRITHPESDTEPDPHYPVPSTLESSTALVDGLVAWLVEIALGAAAPE
jgi:hypothetical protein